jgi:hypothetical protein
MRKPLFSLVSLAILLGLTACSGAGQQQARAVGTPGPAGSLDYRDTWAPGYLFDEDDGKYYRVRPAAPQ